MNANQLHILRHSIGLEDDGSGREYRNHYVTGPDDADCQALVSMGFMVRAQRNALIAQDDFLYRVTEAGMIEARKRTTLERLTRGQVRYREWLKVADATGLSFGEYLKGAPKC